MTQTQQSKQSRSRSLARLTAKQVNSASEPGYYMDGGGLIMHISNNGGKRWLLRFNSPITGKRREMGLGAAGHGGVLLAEVRDQAEAARKLVRAGIDPIDERNRSIEQQRQDAQRQKPVTFGQFCDEWMEANLRQYSNAKHQAQWRMTLTVYAEPLRSKAIQDIETNDVLEVLKPIWEEKPETAKRTQGRIERMLDAATAMGIRTGPNPATWRGHLSNLLPKQPKGKRGHHAAMPWRALPDFIPSLRARQGTAARALEFAILTAARSGEVRGATWNEFDLDARRWTIPAWRMKAKQEHKVPLTDRAIEILNEVAAQRPDSDQTGAALVFPGARTGSKMSDMTLAAVLKRMDVENATPHGFRSAFRDWAEDCADAPYGAIKAALAHMIGDKVDAAYRRGDAYQRRIKLMQEWAEFLDSRPKN
ncbi:tyrosine-type recombinase/integrase [Donghicola tyrosinivorans]|uniref:Integrase n=1 Tax=Donghicola tyrosinivorans TaxID=1652492 RepID=A0A2T0X5Z7_9RHOB|nr:site-specific integrase [Donghicola tyrosinivorans]PRY94347.1 integrase [Donghicola tyrosinivorans]